MKALLGSVPNLPWWKLCNMSDAEIEEFNRRHLVEIEMKDDSLSDVVANKDPWIVGKDDNWFMHNDNRLHKESWNAALEAAANVSEINSAANIRRLKK